MRERLRAVTAREDGISLIEMLAAILILGVALAAFASSMVSSLQAVQRDQRLVVANALATEVVENLQGLPWEQAALVQGDAVSAFGGTTFEGENLVLTSDSSSSAGPAIRSVTRDGVEYSVTTAITWVDDDTDNDEDGDDETGDSDDYKRFVVELEWSLRGNARDLRVTALRTAESRERPLRPEAPDTVPLDDVACNVGPIDLSATTLDPVKSVTASFPARDGSTVEVHLSGSDAQTWSLSLAACPDAGFPDGPVIFTFEAETSQEVYEATEMVVFERDVVVEDEDIAVDPAIIEVDAAGMSHCLVTVTVEVRGGTPDDTVTATWDQGPEPADLDFMGLTDAGARFIAEYSAGTEFGSPGSTTLTIDVDREYDGDEAQGETPVEISESEGPCPS